MTDKIVNACAVLHNMRIAHRLQDIQINDMKIEAFRERNEPDVVEQNDRGYGFEDRALALRIQERFIAHQYSRIQ